MKNFTITTECYAQQDGKLLLLHRVKKDRDINKDKWIGIGGHLEPGESPEEGIRREMLEETGMSAERLLFRGVVTFVYGEITELIFLFMAEGLTDAAGRSITLTDPLPDCDEGELAWVAWEDVMNLPIWEGDKVFLKLLREDAPFFSVKLVYDENNSLVQAIANEEELPLPL
ncbi:MAG: NUDIX domain-containing protein [Lachnospiraceae bacterium]|nr:NUDIX domain-containing protein [Lachnospiraceae bacterium]